MTTYRVHNSIIGIYRKKCSLKTGGPGGNAARKALELLPADLLVLQTVDKEQRFLWLRDAGVAQPCEDVVDLVCQRGETSLFASLASSSPSSACCIGAATMVPSCACSDMFIGTSCRCTRNSTRPPEAPHPYHSLNIRFS